MNVVPAPEGLKVGLKGKVKKLCPFTDEVDEGTVEVTWTTGGETLELHSLREYLDSFKSDKISHEDFVDSLKEDLGFLGSASVKATFTTAGFSVTVTSE